MTRLAAPRAGRGARATAIALAVVATGGLALAEVLVPPPDGDPDLIELLSGIDHIAPRHALDGALGDGAATQLAAIAHADLSDPGVRLRAYRALALYPTEETREMLEAEVAAHNDAERGVEILYLVAAIDSLARVAGEDAIRPLAKSLDHPSRDVRVGTAVAMGATGSKEAIPLLRARLQLEKVEQVRLALSASIRKLDR